MKRIGYNLREVRENISDLAFRGRARCDYFSGKEGRKDFSTVAAYFLAFNENSGWFRKSAVGQKEPNPSIVDKLIQIGFIDSRVKGNHEEIKVSEKARNAQYLFYCNIPQKKTD